VSERIDVAGRPSSGQPAIEQLDLPGVDHAFQMPGGVSGSADALAQPVDGITPKL
jgi:hypothetical protein